MAWKNDIPKKVGAVAMWIIYFWLDPKVTKGQGCWETEDWRRETEAVLMSGFGRRKEMQDDRGGKLGVGRPDEAFYFWLDPKVTKDQGC